MFYKIFKGGSKKHHLIIGLCLAYNIAFFSITSTIISAVLFGVFYLLINRKLNVLNNKVLIFLGTISFSFYLIHQNFGYIIINYLESKGLVSEFYIVIPLIFSILIASLITFYVERPIQNILKNLWKGKVMKESNKNVYSPKEHTVR